MPPLEKEFQQFQSPHTPYKFTEEYIIQQLKSNQIDKTARVCISTIQRMYSILKVFICEICGYNCRF